MFYEPPADGRLEMHMISKAIVDGQLQAMRELMQKEEQQRVESGNGNRAERRRQKAIDRKEAKRKAKVKS